jgi:hypothetical protein
MNPQVYSSIGTRSCLQLSAIQHYCLYRTVYSSVTGRRHSLTIQCHAELGVDHQTVADWSQFCCEAMPNFIEFFTVFYVVWGGGICGNRWEMLQQAKLQLQQVAHNSMGLCWCRAGIGDTCLAHVADRCTETLLAIIKSCILPNITIVNACCGYVPLLNEGLTHHAFDCSVLTEIQSRSHGSTSRFTSGLTEKTKLNV